MNSGMDQKRLNPIRPLMERFIGEGNQLPGAGVGLEAWGVGRFSIRRLP